MNHAFTPKALSALCARCDRSILDHGNNAQCEACAYKGKCDVLGKLLLCPTCMDKEYKAAINATNERLNNPNLEQIIESERIQSYGDFFNAKVTPIVQLKELFELNGHSFAEFHEAIKNKIEHFSRVLFESQITTTDDTVSKLLIEFRAEVRSKLKSGDINYQPPIKAPKVSVPKKKQTPLEKMAEILVASEGKKGNVITIVEAQRRLREEMGMK